MSNKTETIEISNRTEKTYKKSKKNDTNSKSQAEIQVKQNVTVKTKPLMQNLRRICFFLLVNSYKFLTKSFSGQLNFYDSATLKASVRAV